MVLTFRCIGCRKIHERFVYQKGIPDSTGILNMCLEKDKQEATAGKLLWIMTGQSHAYIGVAALPARCLQPWRVGCPLIWFRTCSSEPKSFALGSLCCTRFMRRSFCPLPFY